MYIPRDKASPLLKLNSITEEIHKILMDEGRQNHRFWSDSNHAHKKNVDAFRDEVKDYYYYRQKSRCCYCSAPLKDSARSYDADHILDKSTHPGFMFNPENIAIACPTCNTFKSSKSVLVDELASLTVVPIKSDEYKIVHPHQDEWADHLHFDEIGRVHSIVGSDKGRATVEMCRIDIQNLLILANEFAPEHRKQAHDLMKKVIGYKQRSRILRALDAIEGLTNKTPQAQAIVLALKEKLL